MSEAYTDMSGSDVPHCDLSGCDVPDCDVPDCDVPDCDLSGCDVPDSAAVDASDAQRLVDSTWGLRLRSRIESLEDDSLVVPPSFEDLATYRPTIERLNDLYFQSMIYLARLFMMTLTFVQSSWAVLQKTSKAIRGSFRDEICVFFEGSSYPYRLNDLVLVSPGVPRIEWYYNVAKNTFVTSRLQTNSQHYTAHHIPYLTAQIQYNDLTLYDISDFVNSVLWAGEEGESMPSVDHLVSAWSLSSGVVIERSVAMRLVGINTDGQDVQIPLRNQT